MVLMTFYEFAMLSALVNLMLPAVLSVLFELIDLLPCQLIETEGV